MYIPFFSEKTFRSWYKTLAEGWNKKEDWRIQRKKDTSSYFQSHSNQKNGNEINERRSTL